MNKTENYLENLIKSAPEIELTSSDLKSIQHEGIAKFIFKALSSSKFRQSSLPAELEEKIKNKIQFCVENNLPIHITVPFGGYKKWQLPTYPDVDWAEIFNLVILREYLAPVAKAYEYGVVLHYFSDEIFLNHMDNYPQADLNTYNNSFVKLIEFFQKYLPANFRIEFSKIRDFISEDEIIKRLDSFVAKEGMGRWNKLSKEDQITKLAKSERNLKHNLENLTLEEKNELLLRSTLIHESFLNDDWDFDTPWAFDKDMIAIGFRYTNKWGIHIKSSRSSAVQFWVGTGILLKKDETYIPTILTYKQYLEAQDKLKKINVKIFDKSFANLKSINVLL